MPHDETQIPPPRAVRQDDGAALIEYALIIAVVSIALVLARQPVFVSGQIGSFITRLSGCLSGTACT